MADNYNEDLTQLDNNHGRDERSRVKSNKGNSWRRVAVGAGAGILLGSVSTLLTSFTPHPDIHNEKVPDWVDGKVPVSHDVKDDMSFHEAFDAARSEVGSGGVFQWHGNIYSTYNEAEWTNMSQKEREEYGSHFSWKENAHAAKENVHSNEQINNHDDPDPVEVDTGDVHISHVEEGTVTIGNPENLGLDDGNVEILSISFDDNGLSIANGTVDGHEAIIVDVDNDNVADTLEVDTNNDHHFGTGEIVDISNDNVNFSDIIGYPEPCGDATDSPNTNIDYADSNNEIDVQI